MKEVPVPERPKTRETMAQAEKNSFFCFKIAVPFSSISLRSLFIW